MGTKERMITALSQELVQRKDFLTKVDTVYFGGGTPSLLSKSELSSIFNILHTHFNLSLGLEITLETNPDDINTENLIVWRALGINRLSIGCQTFDDTILKKLNRIHQAKTSIDTFELARAYGFNNISIDLMFGLPGQTEDLWNKDLEIACTLNPEHISAYGLTIESKTVFGHQVAKGLLTIPNENTQANCYEHMMSILEQKGYEQYEISNFCLPGFESKHNSSYWEQEIYLGIGPSAHSFDGECRMWNHSNNISYIKAIEQGEMAYSFERLSREDRTHEYILTALRTKKGINTEKLIHQLNYPEKKLTEIITLLRKNQWIKPTNDQIQLTPSGKLLADEITLKFFLH